MNSSAPLIGIDAKRIVRNGTGLGSYGRTLVNDLAQYPLHLNLYAPDKGRDDLRTRTYHFSFLIPPFTFHFPSLIGAAAVSLPILSAMAYSCIMVSRASCL